MIAAKAEALAARAQTNPRLPHVLGWGTILVLAATLGIAGWPRWWSVTTTGAHTVLVNAEVLIVVEVASLLLWRTPLICFLVAETALVFYGMCGYPSTPANYAGLVATAIAAWGCAGWFRFASLAGAVLGVLAVGLGRPGGAPWAELLANLILVLGAWCAGWGARGQQDAHRARLTAASEAEALRIAEERLAMAHLLHDRVGNTLAAVTRQLESADVLEAEEAPSVTRRVDARLRATLAEIAELVDSWSAGGQPTRDLNATEDGGGLENGRHPENEDQLFARMQIWMASLASSGLAVEIWINRDLRLQPLQDRLLALALEQGLSNVAKHSAASRVVVRVEHVADRVALRIWDEGPPRIHVVPSAGTGLMRVQRRFEALGGSLHAGPGSRNGFELCAELPKTVG